MKYPLITLLILTASSAFSQTDKQQIATLRSDWCRYLEQKQLTQATDQYTDDAIFYSPGATPSTGKAAIRQLYTMVMKLYDAHCIFMSAGTTLSSNIAYDSGRYQETMLEKKTHKMKHLQGNYLMTLKKTGQGWKISRLMWTDTK